MAFFTPAFIVIAAFIIFILLYSLNPLYVNIFLLGVFVWAYPNLSDKQAGYYLLLLFAVLILSLINRAYAVDQEKQGSLLGFKFLGLQWIFVNLLIGGAVLVFMAFLQGRSTSAILGVATLSASAPAYISSTFGPAITGLLGLIENRFIFTIVDFLKTFWVEITSIVAPLGVLSQILVPLGVVGLAALFFSILHVSAYSYMVISLAFAFIVAVVWIVLYLILKNSIAADVAHMAWNSLISLGKNLKIVTNTGSGLNVAGG